MSPTTPEERDPLADRLRDAFPAEVAPATRHRDLAAIDEAVAGAGVRLRRGVAVAVAGLVVAAPAGALASDSALPGEALYPVKRVTEVVRQVFDEDVADRHRVEEAEVLADRAAAQPTEPAPPTVVAVDVEAAVDAAFDAVVATEDRPDADDLRRRALAAADRIRDRAEDLVVAMPADADRIARAQAERLERLRRELQRQQALRERAQRDQDRADDQSGSDREPGDRPASSTPAPTRTADDRPTDARPSDADPATASPAPTRSPDRASPTPTSSPRPTTSPRPATSPEPTDSPRPDSSPSASPTKDDAATPRKERHEVGRAGVVHLVVRDEGVRLSEVVVADEWTAKADRSREPDGFTVEFRHRKDGRGLLFTARHRDDGTVETSIRELPPPDDSRSDEPAPDSGSSNETAPGDVGPADAGEVSNLDGRSTATRR